MAVSISWWLNNIFKKGLELKWQNTAENHWLELLRLLHALWIPGQGEKWDYLVKMHSRISSKAWVADLAKAGNEIKYRQFAYLG
jgi:hypothetical protein